MAEHDAIFLANRRTPKIVKRGERYTPKPSEGKIVKRRRLTADEEKIIARGDWLRVNQRGEKPGDSGYMKKRSKVRPQLGAGVLESLTAASQSWRWQLRDNKGRWIEMGAEVKWLAKGRWMHGLVVDSPDESTATVEESSTKERMDIPTASLEVVEKMLNAVEGKSAKEAGLERGSAKDVKAVIDWNAKNLAPESPAAGTERRAKHSQQMGARVQKWLDADTAPWDDIEGMRAGKYDGIEVRPLAGAKGAQPTVGRYDDDTGNFVLTEAGLSGDPGWLKSLITHEAGHALQLAVFTDALPGGDLNSGSHERWAPLRRAEASTYVDQNGIKSKSALQSPFWGDGPGSHADEPKEIFADAISLILSGKTHQYRDNEQARYVLDWAAEEMGKAGWPIPELYKQDLPEWTEWRADTTFDGIKTWTQRPGGDEISIRKVKGGYSVIAVNHHADEPVVRQAIVSTLAKAKTTGADLLEAASVTAGAGGWCGTTLSGMRSKNLQRAILTALVAGGGDSWKWQLRDADGKWIEMGAIVSWFYKGAEVFGEIVGSPSDGVARVRRNDNGKEINLYTSSLRVDEKAAKAAKEAKHEEVDPFSFDSLFKGVIEEATNPSTKVADPPPPKATVAVPQPPGTSTTDEPEPSWDDEAWSAVLDSYDLSELRQKVAKINDRAVKKGLTGRIHVLARKTDGGKWEVQTQGRPKLDSKWELAAVIDGSKPESAIVNRNPNAPDEILNMDIDKSMAGHCDYCNTTRDRKTTYVLKGQTGETKYVGSSCLADFLGHSVSLGKNPFDTGEEDIDGWLGEKAYLPSSEVLFQTIRVVDKFGFKKTTELVNTRDMVHLLLHDDYKFEQRYGTLPELTDADKERIRIERDEVLEWARAGVSITNTDYRANLGAALSDVFMDPKNLGLVVSAITSYRREKQKLAEKKAKLAEIKHELIAPVGTKITKVPARIVGISKIQTKFGISTKITFYDKEGHRVVWWASNAPSGLNEGDEVLLTGKVKKEDTYGGGFSTIITHGKIEPNPTALVSSVFAPAWTGVFEGDAPMLEALLAATESWKWQLRDNKGRWIQIGSTVSFMHGGRAISGEVVGSPKPGYVTVKGPDGKEITVPSGSVQVVEGAPKTKDAKAGAPAKKAGSGGGGGGGGAAAKPREQKATLPAKTAAKPAAAKPAAAKTAARSGDSEDAPDDKRLNGIHSTASMIERLLQSKKGKSAPSTAKKAPAGGKSSSGGGEKSSSGGGEKSSTAKKSGGSSSSSGAKKRDTRKKLTQSQIDAVSKILKAVLADVREDKFSAAMSALKRAEAILKNTSAPWLSKRIGGLKKGVSAFGVTASLVAGGDSWRWQLRDRLGKWIEMGAEVKWLARGRWLQGIVVGSPSPGVATVEERHSRKEMDLPTSSLEIIKNPDGSKVPQRSSEVLDALKSPDQPQSKASKASKAVLKDMGPGGRPTIEQANELLDIIEGRRGTVPLGMWRELALPGGVALSYEDMDATLTRLRGGESLPNPDTDVVPEPTLPVPSPEEVFSQRLTELAAAATAVREPSSGQSIGDRLQKAVNQSLQVKEAGTLPPELTQYEKGQMAILKVKFDKAKAEAEARLSKASQMAWGTKEHTALMAEYKDFVAANLDPVRAEYIALRDRDLAHKNGIPVKGSWQPVGNPNPMSAESKAVLADIRGVGEQMVQVARAEMVRRREAEGFDGTNPPEAYDPRGNPRLLSDLWAAELDAAIADGAKPKGRWLPNIPKNAGDPDAKGIPALKKLVQPGDIIRVTLPAVKTTENPNPAPVVKTIRVTGKSGSGFGIRVKDETGRETYLSDYGESWAPIDLVVYRGKDIPRNPDLDPNKEIRDRHYRWKAIQHEVMAEVIAGVRGLAETTEQTFEFKKKSSTDKALTPEMTEMVKDALLKVYPKAWVERMDRKTKNKRVTFSMAKRGSFDNTKHMRLSDYSGEKEARGGQSHGTAIHEWMHAMESSIPGLVEVQEIYWFERMFGPDKMDVVPAPKGASEDGGWFPTGSKMVSKFRNRYTSKKYTYGSISRVGWGYEIMTTGVQDIFGEVSGNYVGGDDDFKAFVLGTLATLG